MKALEDYGRQAAARQFEGTGAKNAVLPIMAASIIAECETELTNCSNLSDVRASVDILRHLGCQVSREGDIVNIDSRGMTRNYIPHELMREMRSSVIFLGAILARCGEATLSLPGGCELGPRPIDLHLDALRKLGADITERSGNIYCRAERLVGTHINFELPSVGATENAILAACAAEGETIITNAARSRRLLTSELPHQDGRGYGRCGNPHNQGEGIKPVERVGHRIMTDRIVCATILCAVRRRRKGGAWGVVPKHLRRSAALKGMGCEIETGRHRYAGFGRSP